MLRVNLLEYLEFPEKVIFIFIIDSYKELLRTKCMGLNKMWQNPCTLNFQNPAD